MNVDDMRKFSDDRKISKFVIITLKDNDISRELAQRCRNSIRHLHSETEIIYFEAFDGTKNDGAIHCDGLEEYLKLIKVPNNIYSSSQIACFMSHFALWMECILNDKPIVILEHDAICVKEIREHKFYNCIQFLGCKEQIEGSLRVDTIPPHASIYGGHWRSLCRAHAYAIDPPVARMLVSKAIHEGMTKTLDMWIRADIFPIIQDGVYFYDERGESTIHAPEDTLKDY